MVCSLSVSGAVRLREKERSHFPVCGRCKSVAGVSLIGSLVVENLSHVRNTVLAKFFLSPQKLQVRSLNLKISCQNLEYL